MTNIFLDSKIAAWRDNRWWVELRLCTSYNTQPACTVLVHTEASFPPDCRSVKKRPRECARCLRTPIREALTSSVGSSGGGGGAQSFREEEKKNPQQEAGEFPLEKS